VTHAVARVLRGPASAGINTSHTPRPAAEYSRLAGNRTKFMTAEKENNGTNAHSRSPRGCEFDPACQLPLTDTGSRPRRRGDARAAPGKKEMQMNASPGNEMEPKCRYLGLRWKRSPHPAIAAVGQRRPQAPLDDASMVLPPRNDWWTSVTGAPGLDPDFFLNVPGLATSVTGAEGAVVLRRMGSNEIMERATTTKSK